MIVQPVVKSLIVVAIVLAGSDAVACDLSLVAPAWSALKNPVQASAALSDDTLTVRFTISEPSLNAKKVLGLKNNLARLTKIKSAVGPKNIFRYAQSVPLDA